MPAEAIIFRMSPFPSRRPQGNYIQLGPSSDGCLFTRAFLHDMRDRQRRSHRQRRLGGRMTQRDPGAAPAYDTLRPFCAVTAEQLVSAVMSLRPTIALAADTRA